MGPGAWSLLGSGNVKDVQPHSSRRSGRSATRSTKPSHRSAVRLTAAIAAAAVAFGCGAQGPSKLKLKVDVERRANNDHPVRMDLLVVYEPELMDEFDSLTATEWFQQREQRLRNNPDRSRFGVWSWEWAPGQDIDDSTLRLPGVPAQGVIFANYQSRGAHTARFDPMLAQHIWLRQDGLRIQAGKANEPESRSWRPVVGWSMVGLGFAGLGLGTYFGVKASDDARKTINLKPKDQARHDELSKSVDDNQTRMAVSYSIGGVFVIAGLVVLLWPEDDDSPFRPVPTGDGAAVRLIEW